MKGKSGLTGTPVIMAVLAAAFLFAACGDGGGEAVYYSVTFNAGEGRGAPPANLMSAAGTVITLPGQGSMTAPSGKTFGGWTTGGGILYQASGTFTVDADVTFTAQWEDGKTYVRFTNLEQFPVSIYKDAARLTEIASVPASGTARVEAEATTVGTTFYPRFQITVDGLTVFMQNGPAVTVRVDANRTTEVTIPRLTAVTGTIACVKIDNQSVYSLTFNRDGYELHPLGVNSTIVMPQETAVYAVQAGGVSGCAVMRNTTHPVAIRLISEFQGGGVYTFRYDGSELILISVEDALGNSLSRFTVSTAAEMEDALAFADYSSHVVIDIAQNFSMEPVSLTHSDVIFTIMGDTSGEKVISLSGAGSLFTVGSGVTLRLGNNITLRGINNNTAALVTVNSGGTLTMSAGAKITGNDAIPASSSTVYGGGVYVNGGAFTMNGGEISGNAASYGGGAFTKSGGTIYGSNASGTSLRNAADRDRDGHAVYAATSPDKIRNTTAGSGVTLDSSVTGASGGWEIIDLSSNLSLEESLTWIGNNAQEGGAYTIALNADGIIAPKTLSYSGQTISITLEGGASERTVGLNANGSLFTVGSGVTLRLGNNITLRGRSANTASLVTVNGGGTLTMSAGAKIAGNAIPALSSTVYGGGVYVNGGAFTMNGGEISGNAASYGGGVYVSGSGAFTKSGGTIYGSNASGTSLQNAADHDRCGHAVYAATSPAKIRDTTADSSVTLDSSVTGASGNWENASGISNITYGSVLGGTWTSQSDGSRKSPAVGHGGVAKTRVSFKSAAGAFITIQLTVSSEAGCDYAFISQLDNASATYQSGYYAGSLISGSTSVTVTIPVPTAGNHFIEIGYRKDGSLSSGSDCAWFMIVE